MTDPQIDPSKPPESMQPTYQRLLHRIRESLEQVEKKTAEAIQYEIEQAIELEATAEEMTREELDLLGAYLKRDLNSLSRFAAKTGKGVAEWLKFDLHLLEDKLANLLLSVADRTLLEQEALVHQLDEEGDDNYVVGETVLAGTFACQNCGDIYVVTQPKALEACLECGADSFRRVSTD